MRLLISILMLLFVMPATAAEGGYYIGPGDGVDLRLRPDNKATVSGHLDSNTAVEVIDRERNWTKVMTIGRGIKGWVPAGAVRKSAGTTSSGSSSSFFSSFASLFRSPEPPRKTAVLGV
ncbi:MAG: SH3 domain-containing protein, partial [Mariprofundaceae bacterium]|nr:SH3 domain-containing protein [Mariprofundaceae bacterium]